MRPGNIVTFLSFCNAYIQLGGSSPAEIEFVESVTKIHFVPKSGK
jgi:hypothetical protein